MIPVPPSPSGSRIFPSDQFLQPIAQGDPIRSVVLESQAAIVVAWHLHPGQEIAPHVHPHGQDTWTILTGKGQYYLDRAGNSASIQAGDVVVAPVGSVHGVLNTGDDPLTFISVVSPGDAGYQQVEVELAVFHKVIG